MTSSAALYPMTTHSYAARMRASMSSDSPLWAWRIGGWGCFEGCTGTSGGVCRSASLATSVTPASGAPDCINGRDGEDMPTTGWTASATGNRDSGGMGKATIHGSPERASGGTNRTDDR